MTLKLNKEQQGLKLIQVNGGFVVVNLNAEITHGDWYIFNLSKLGEWGYEKFHSDYRKFNKYQCAKIIFATPNLNLEGVPVIEEKESEIFDKLYASLDYCYSDYKIFEKGYKQAQKNLFTEEEAIGFYLWARKKYGSVKPIEEGCIVAKTDYSGLFQLYIQETKQPKVEITFENNTPIKCIML